MVLIYDIVFIFTVFFVFVILNFETEIKLYNIVDRNYTSNLSKLGNEYTMIKEEKSKNT